MSTTVFGVHLVRDKNLPDLRRRVNIYQGFDSLIKNTVTWFRAEEESPLVQIVRRVLSIATAVFLVLSLAGIAILVQGISTWKTMDAAFTMKNLPGKEEREIIESFKILKAYHSLYPEVSDEATAKWINKYQLSADKLKLTLEDFKRIGIHLFHLDLRGTQFTPNEIQEIFSYCKNARAVFLSNNNIEKIENLPPSIKILNVEECSNLKTLKLKNYINLQTLHRFPQNLKKLKISNCNSLSILPPLPHKLKNLIISNSSLLCKIPTLPKTLAYLTLKSMTSPMVVMPHFPVGLRKLEIRSIPSLVELSKLPEDLQILHLEDLPALKEDIGVLPLKLQTFSMINCPKLKKLPDLNNGLLEFSCVNFGCTAVPKLPSSLQKMHLGSSLSPIQSLPELPTSLYTLSVCYFEQLKELPIIPPSVTELKMECCPLIKDISLSDVGLKHLTITSCENFKSLPNTLPKTLKDLTIIGCPFEDFSLTCASLKTLSLINTNINQIHKLPSNLVNLCIANNSALTTISELPLTLKNFDMSSCVELKSGPALPETLKEFNCSGCLALTSIPELPESLEKFYCNSLKVTKLPKLIHTNIEIFGASSLVNLKEFPEIPATVEEFNCQDCTQLTRLPYLPNSLVKLTASNLSSLKFILQLPPTLKRLNIADCTQLLQLPETFPVALIHLDIRNCPKLEHIPEQAHSLKILSTGCPAKLSHHPREIIFH